MFLYQIISALIIPLEVAFGRALLRCRCMNVSVGFIKVSKHKTPILLNLIKVAGLVSSSNSVNNFESKDSSDRLCIFVHNRDITRFSSSFFITPNGRS